MQNINIITRYSRLLSLAFWKLLLVSFLVTIVGCDSDEPNSPKVTDYTNVKENMTKFIETSMKQYDMTGVSIALVDGDEENPVVWSQGFGFADKENNIPATADTVYRAGSITKLFTGMAIMQLVEQGKLDIDQPIQTYLPELKINSHFNSTEPVTIKNMLTHHSGLPSNELKSMWGDDTADSSDLLKQTYDLASPSNTQYSYSNLAFGLLGEVVEKVSGLSYEDYVQQNLLNSMNMSQSYMDKTLIANTNHAKGYFKGENYPIVPLRDVSTGGLNSTVLDLAKFAQITFPEQSEQVLSDETLKQMKSSQVTGNSPFLYSDVGLAWFFNDSFDKRTKGNAGIFAGHSGSTALFQSEFMTLPKHKLAVIVMTNSLDENDSATDAIANELLQMAFEAKTQVHIDPEPDFQLPSIIPTTQDALSNMPGLWLSDLGVFQIEKNGNSLVWNFNDTPLPLANRGNDIYYLDYQSAGLNESDVGENATLGLKYVRNTDTEALSIAQSGILVGYAEKLKPQQISDMWQNRLGSYQMINQGDSLQSFSDVQLGYDNGILVIQGLNKNFYEEAREFMFAFEVINDQQAAQYGIGRNKGYSLIFKTASDGSEHMYLSGYEFKKSP